MSINITNPEIVEQNRIDKMKLKSLVYLERLECLMILIEVSYTLRTVNRISFIKR
ncbi:hypothetical protein [Flavobacterium aquidurense]|uniref:Uncharacterized protein n=1 Tax=Flavobacterium aquidurense TaxID=362413 RepID=A0A0Q0WP30_9FLAO|nr:hypothetical protein [Flavobacterium aquidurense]KQB37534.1 hypothetical protein RC62_2700 [Flavobacterium aquidurense]